MKKIFKALVVDDERLARRDLMMMLDDYENIEVIGEAVDVSSAMKAIIELKPDVIFLDIQMPGDSGFDLLDKMRVDAKIIFVTAFDEYAIRAFEINALDYLLKPINPDRLAASIERLEIEESSENVKTRKLNYDDRLFLMLSNKMKFLKIKDILSIQSAGDYSEVLTRTSHKELTLKSMKEWEARLPATYFVRIHRSTIVNMEYIEKIEEWFNYSYRVYVKGVEKPYVMSRRYTAKLKEMLG